MSVARSAFVKRALGYLVVSSVCVLAPARASAQAAVLIAAGDPSQLTEVQLAKVMADDSSLWLSVRIKGSTRLALVTAAPSVQASKSSDAWLRALDFSTRMHVAPPAGPLAACAKQGAFPLADTGLPEPALLAAEAPTNADSELELRRSLANAGVNVGVSELDAFSAAAAPPYRISWFDANAEGGSSAALRLLDHGHALELPPIAVSGLDSLPLTLIALASDAVLPVAGEPADPSDFAVTYFAASASTDYASARAGWQRENPERWLSEASATSALADADFAKEQPSSVADELAESATELGTPGIRLSRLFGTLSVAGATFRVAPGEVRNPRLVATDFDSRDCSTPIVGAPSSGAAGLGSSSPGRTPVPSGVDASGTSSAVGVEQSSDASVAQPRVVSDDGSCDVTVFSSSDDSCSGHPSSTEPPSNDSCSGDSSSDNSSSDSCSGNSSSDSQPADDSCSGKSDSSSKGSSGCGSSDDSGYDGDTCTGNSSNSASKSSALLETPAGGSVARRPRPRRLHLSLLTLLAAGLSLPLRRLVK
jgi:hypothetical protein